MVPESPSCSFTTHSLNSPIPCTLACNPRALPRLSISFPLLRSTNLRDSRSSFGKMPDRTSTKSSLILAHTRSKDFMQAFNLFIQISKSGLSPDEFVLGSLLKASASLADLDIGEQLHAKSIRTGLASEPGVRTSLIAMYSTCGRLDASRCVFDEFAPANECDVPSWNSIMSAYAFHGQCAKCFALFSNMLAVAHLLPTVATYAIVISACASMEDIELGKIIHAMIVKEVMLDKTKMLNSLITLYAKCGCLEDANRLFKVMDGMNIVSWNAIIAGHEQNGECESALELFHRLTKLEPEVVVKPNRITFLSVLSAISSISALKLGREVHACLIRSGLECQTSIGNSIITLYGKCGQVEQARLVFERLTARDVVSWNSMLMGYAQNKKSNRCYKLFKEMQSLGIKADNHTLTILLAAFSSDTFTSNCCRLGREVHGYLLRRSVGKALNVSAYNAILTMYAKSNRLDDAEKLFVGMSERDSYSWNAMMDGYSMNGFSDDAVQLFVLMHEQGLRYDHLTLSILLTACSRLVSIELGKQFHALTVKYLLHHRNRQTSLLSISNALVSMYAKCGNINDATKVFHRMVRRDVLSWTAMITGYAHHGMAYKSIRLFERMKRDGIEPNSVTFLGLLTACAHTGLVSEGTYFFSLMSNESGSRPSVEHYACMVDLYGRSGRFDKAEEMVETGISQLGLRDDSCLCLWKVLLGACHAHKQLELGVCVATKILEIEPEDETTHVLLSNLFAAFGLWSDAVAVRKFMKDRGLKKEAGCSWVEALNGRHVFVAGDVSHPNRKEIYEKLEELNEKCRDIGYIPMMECVLQDVDKDLKEAILRSHSEKLAVSFALLQTRNNGVIRVIKNLRICGDCHNWMKFSSQVEGQEIVLRDPRRFHFFKDGRCSCGDYW